MDRVAPVGLPLPAALVPGDRVAVVALSSPVPDDRLDAGLAVLRSWDLDVVEVSGLRARHPDLPYLAGTDEERAAALVAAWTDPQVRAVLVGRGGYGVPRILDLLDWDALAAAGPRTLVGFSDVTPLLHQMVRRLGYAAVHGPAVTGLGDGHGSSRASVRDLLTGPPGERVVADGLDVLVPGDASGPLVGGNLALLAASPDDLLPAGGALVLLEDVDESPHRLDRTLTTLLRSGWLDDAAGVVLGGFTRCGDDAVVRALLIDRLGGLGVPVVAGAPVGHDEPNLAVPIGATAHLRGGSFAMEVERLGT
ncbi:MAG: LD-carboxypeptidase [Candidatus Nanopelagicales bacterium]